MSYSQGDEFVENEASDCCGADIIYQDICNECKEHCDVFKDDEL